MPRTQPPRKNTRHLDCTQRRYGILRTKRSRRRHFEFNHNTRFLTALETGMNKFQTLLPVNIRKKGGYPYSPSNGQVVTTSTTVPQQASPPEELFVIGISSKQVNCSIRISCCPSYTHCKATQKQHVYGKNTSVECWQKLAFAMLKK